MASIRQRGDSWQARIVREGFPAEVRSFSTKAEAKRWATGVEAAMHSGVHHPSAGANALTLRQLLERYGREVTPTKRGADDEMIRIRAVHRHKFTAYAMAKLTPAVIAAFRDERLKQVKPGAVIRDLSIISSVINHARREWGLTVPNPCELVRKPATPPGRSRVLSPEEEARLLEGLRPIGRRNPWVLPAVQLALATAMRRGEILTLEWEHVDLQSRTAYLPMTKNGRPRVVPLSSQAVSVLEALPGPREGLVIRVSPAVLLKAFERARVGQGLRDLRFHDLRHTAATRMAAKLPNVIELSAVTGHRSIQMLKRYYHPDARALAQKLG